jgi:hypothetical protein
MAETIFFKIRDYIFKQEKNRIEGEFLEKENNM